MTSQGAARAGLRGELGWRSMQGEIWRRKLSYYGIVKNMKDNRWPKIVFMEVENENPVRNAWLKEVQKAMDEVGVIYNNQGVKKWRRVVDRIGNKGYGRMR